MLVTGFPAGSFQTNCWVVAPAEGGPCVVVDPGQDAWPALRQVLDEHRLSPVAVLLTHGHVDHTFCVVPVCDAYDVPAYIHPADRAQIADPGLGFGMAPGTPMFGGLTFAEPADVVELHDGDPLVLAGMAFEVRLAAGHTPGSLVFGTEGHLLAGDTLFKDGIGRMDLAGGSEEAMVATIRDVILPMDDAVRVYPGHGETTTIGRERLANPYVRHVLAGGTSFGAPPRPRGL